MYQYFIPFWSWIIFLCVYIPQFIHDGHLGCVRLLEIVNSVAIICIQVFFGVSIFSSFGYIWIYMIWNCWLILDLWLLFSTEAAPFYIPTNHVQKFHSSPPSAPLIFLNIIIMMIIVIFVWSGISLWFWLHWWSHSLMTNNIVDLFMYCFEH